MASCGLARSRYGRDLLDSVAADSFRHAPPPNFHESGDFSRWKNLFISAAAIRLDLPRGPRPASGTPGKCRCDPRRTRHLGVGPDDTDRPRKVQPTAQMHRLRAWEIRSNSPLVRQTRRRDSPACDRRAQRNSPTKYDSPSEITRRIPRNPCDSIRRYPPPLRRRWSVDPGLGRAGCHRRVSPHACRSHALRRPSGYYQHRNSRPISTKIH